MSATELVGSHPRNRFLEIHESKLKSVKKIQIADNFTLYNVCAVPWGVFSTVGGVQYRGGYHEYRGGIS